MLHKVFNDNTPEYNIYLKFFHQISDFLKQIIFLSSHLIPCLKPFFFFFFFFFAFIRCGLNVHLAQYIFGDNEQNYWDLWIQRVPDLGDTEEWSVRLIK